MPVTVTTVLTNEKAIQISIAYRVQGTEKEGGGWRWGGKVL